MIAIESNIQNLEIRKKFFLKLSSLLGRSYLRQYFILDLKLHTPLHCMCYCNKVFWTLDLIYYYQNEYLPIILSFINNFWKHQMRVLHYFFPFFSLSSSYRISVLKLINFYLLLLPRHTLYLYAYYITYYVHFCS